MDYRSRAQKTNNTYKGVTVTNDIRGNGRKKLLLIGKTGAGKSSVRFKCTVSVFRYNISSMLSALQRPHWSSS